VREVARERVRMLQSRGQVSYEVTPDPDRGFEVDAADVRVIVHGTRFSVTVDESWVRVAVVTGRVEVYDGLRSAMLTNGEEIRVRGYVARASESAPLPSAVLVPSASAPSPPRASPETAQSLLDQADAARRAGRPSDAAAALRTLVTRYPSDPRAAAAWFHARSHREWARQRGRSGRRFCPLPTERPGPARRGCARGGGHRAEQRRAGREYLAEYPNGTHKKRMQAIVARAAENR